MSNETLRITPLNDLHLELGAKMVPFAGYQMPVQFPSGIVHEHQHCRAAAGLFDVSHMGQVRIEGPNPALALEALVPVDVVSLEVNCQRYGLFTNPQGGILDDLMITNLGDALFLVINAACKEQDLTHLKSHLIDHSVIELADQALLALQGPQAALVLQRLAPQLDQLVFMTSSAARLDDIDCFISRSGYTGEDGFEISVPADAADRLARRLLREPEVLPIGLGARDTLRLEAGLCLYGHDLNSETTPVEAALTWALSKARRSDGARPGGFPGSDVIADQLTNGATRRRVGILPAGRAPVREGAELVDKSGQSIGVVTSGGFGPSIGGPVAMGYVNRAAAVAGTEIQAIVRGKPLPATVVKLPFVAHGYVRG